MVRFWDCNVELLAVEGSDVMFKDRVTAEERKVFLKRRVFAYGFACII